MPTCKPKTGILFKKKGKIFVRNANFTGDNRPLEEGCLFYTCCNFSRSYLRHLFNVKEILAMQLNTIHNIYFMERLMQEIRESIKEDRFLEYKKEFMSRFVNA